VNRIVNKKNMRKVKIKDLATEISITVKDVLSKCKDLSIIARSSASSISEDDAAKIKISFSPDNDKVKKSPRDVIKRSGAKVTIRRKKAPVFKIEEKTEDEQEVAKEKQAEEQVSKEEIKEEIKTKQDSQPTKTVTRETKRVYSPAKTNERDVKPKSKDDKQTNVTKEPPAKIQKEFRSEDAKKKTETKKNKQVEKKKVQIKPSKEEIIDEDAMDVLRKAVRAKLPGGRKEYLISNNFAKKTRTQKDSQSADEIDKENGIESNTRTKTKVNKIKIQEKIIITLLATKLKAKIGQVISKASELGLKLTAKDEIDSDEATIIASEFNYEVEVDSYNEKSVLEEGFLRKDSDIQMRPPIITVMGHVDHGKTSLLDYIRKSKVVDKEHGGITQSIGAYSVNVNKKNLVFIDTPGHAAFSAMRSRGASLTDIIILVVAADDGVMPQTDEAISHAKSANVPIVVAVNKIDKEDSNVDSIKTQLSEKGLTPEDWGGDTPFVPVSALNGKGIDDLLEIVVLQSDVMELKANSKIPSSGYILEAYLDKGRGVVATLIPKEGEIKRGDTILCGTNSGRIRALIDDKGKQLMTSAPSYPVEILGLDGVPEAGLQYNIVKNDKIAKDVIRNRLSNIEDEKSFKSHTVDLDFINSDLQLLQIKELPVIVKADTQGSLDALVSALLNFESEKCKAKIVHSAVGTINESDFMLAESTGSIILGFSTNVEPKVQAMLDKSSIRCETYKIIYEILDRIKELLEGLLDPILEERVTGHAEIREIFNLSKQGKIAGCLVNDGKAVRGHNIRVKREDEIVFETTITSLKRFKDDVKEVASGFECGIGFENMEDIKQGDTIEIFTFDKINQTI
tara:strand:+ start:1580 stop:4135 length:2556 start_codon:yes stop_codon:yes gene_type:complete